MANDTIEKNKTQTDDTFDVTGLLLNYLANWKWFVLSALVCLVAGYFYYKSQIPQYEVTASIYLNDDNSQTQNIFGSNAVGSLVDVKSAIDDTELEMLKSRNNVVRIVDSLGLAYSYFSKASLRDNPLYQDNAIVASMDPKALKELSSTIEILVSKAGKDKYKIATTTYFKGIKEEKIVESTTLPTDVETPYGTVHLEKSRVINKFDYIEKIVISNPRWVAGAISGSLNIGFTRNSQKIIRISLLTDNIKKGTDIIRTMLDFYNQNIIEDKNRSAVQTEAFILDRLVMISNELKDVEERLLEYRSQHNVTTDINSQAAMNMSLKTGYEQELADADAELDILNEIERIVTITDTYQTLPTAFSNNAINSIIETYNRKVSNLNRMLEGSTSDNPLVISMRDELSRDKARILQNIEAAKRNLSSRRQSITKLDNRSSGLLAAAPAIDKGLNEIFREQQVKVNIYTFLLQRREEIALQKTLATNTAQLIDNPSGYGPVSPKRMYILGIAFLIGLLIPAGIILLRRILFPVFADKDELERLTKVPVLGEVCIKEKGKSKGNGNDIVIGENVSTPIAELFRLLRNGISFTQNGANNKVILVTSSISGEGKTFVASNLAMTYALTGKKTLVMGLDLRRPALSHRLGIHNRTGITTFLSGQSNDIESLISPTNENPNLFVLPAGPVPPNPNELMMSERMAQLIDYLRKNYDYIIIDSAPIGVISDSFLLMRYSDLQIFVTRAKYTSKHSLNLLHSAVAKGMMNNPYIVINAVDIASNSYSYRKYGYYSHYGHSKNVYGYGYTNKK